ENTGGHVPRRKRAFPIAVVPAGRGPGQIQRSRAETSQAGDDWLHRGQFPGAESEIAAAVMRQPAGNDAVHEPAPRRYAQALVVEKGSFAALGEKHLVVGRIVDQSRDDRSFALKRDRDCELRNAVQEIRRAVERIDDPEMGAIAALDAAAFLAEEAIARPRLGQFLAQDFFGALVRSGDEVGRPLHRYLELLHLAEVAFERAAGKPRGFDHHIEQGGMRHDFEPVGYAAAARRQERAAYT